MLSLLSIPISLLLATAASAVVHDIQVGNSTGGTIFTPDAISANPGDQVVFHFQQKNHSVTQSSFAGPCTHLDGGFNSGFMPVPANQTDNFPTFTIGVNDTKPIWVYCAQAANTPESHCGKGMVFAVNCGANGAANSFTNFQNAALAIGQQLNNEPTAVTTAAYGTATIPAAPTPVLVTATVSVQSTQWTTTYSSYPGSANPTPVALRGVVHTVTVGDASGDLTYNPPFVSAQPMDTIVFEFHQKNHTATQSSFDAPCLSNGGLDSGFMPVAENVTSGFPTWSFTVNTTSPTWFYCRQHTPAGASHCGSGMVFAVNPVQDSPRNFTAFQQLAMTLNGTSSTNGSSPTSSSPSSSSPSSPSPTTSSSGASANMATNAGIALGSLFALIATLL